uniref:Uncharacterized protein n=1 Tax=Kalanchoe fedtschenkoi TaxID=63787 RepID=A0A7N0TCT0_KALFE
MKSIKDYPFEPLFYQDLNSSFDNSPFILGKERVMIPKKSSTMSTNRNLTFTIKGGTS